MRTSSTIGVALCSVLLSACATSAPQTTMSADEAIAARQERMKAHGAAMRSINDKLKSGQVQAVATDAEKLVDSAKQLPGLFGTPSANPQTSRAKPEIWQRKAEFDGYAKTLETKATQLAAIARTGDAKATQATVADIGRTTCTACHDAFRGPEIKR
jgi:cytochrome c556